MARGKYQAPKAGVKVLSMVLTLTLLLCGIIGGTVAWLIASTEDVVNKFTYGDINIELNETDTGLDKDNNNTTNEYEMMPGQSITKDPTVTVKAGSENNWLFVKLVESDNFDDFMTYTIGDGWVQLLDDQGNAVEGVYYRFQAEIAENAEDVAISVLKDNEVVVKDEVTKEMLNALDPEGADADYPTLTVTAYAVQYVGFEPEITEGDEGATADQVNAAALNAWLVATAE